MVYDDHVQQTAKLLERAAQEALIFISGDGRVGEADLGRLLGYAPGSLKNMRNEGRGPPAYGIGMNGCRVSYRLVEVAAWIERSREEN